MDLAERYFQLSLLGRETFLESVAHGVLVRRRHDPIRSLGTAVGSSESCTALARVDPFVGGLSPARHNLEIYPLAKKPGGAFVDLVTVGRTSDNDIQLEDISVSRFHAFFRRRQGRWFLCDAGSSNGTRVHGKRLELRSEREVRSATPLHFGGVEMTFYVADALFDVLSSPT